MESPYEKRKRIVQKLLCKKIQDSLLYKILREHRETQHYILYGTWRDTTKLAPTRAVEKILLQSEQWQQEDERKRQLTVALRKNGLELRDDSALCQGYILYGLGELDTTVDTMIEMNWFYTQTNYKAILQDLYDRNREEYFYESESYEPMHPVEMSNNAKHIVLKAMWLSDTKMPTTRLQIEFEKIKEKRWIHSMRANWDSIHEYDCNSVLPTVLIDIVGNYLDIRSRNEKRSFSLMNAQHSEYHCSGCYQQIPARECKFHLCATCCIPENDCRRHYKKN